MSNFDLLFLPEKALLDSKALFSPVNAVMAKNANWDYLTDIQKAKHHAWRVDEDLVEIWTDLREKQAAGLPDFEGAYEYWSGNYYDSLETYLASLGYEELTSDVEADLFHCCINAHFNSGNRLWTDIMTAYSVGLWPIRKTSCQTKLATKYISSAAVLLKAILYMSHAN